jgi:hypothetical protein
MKQYRIINKIIGGENMDIKSWHRETIGKTAVAALIKTGFDAIYVSTPEEATDIIMNHVSPGISVGFGGSMTIAGMGIQGKVEAAGAKVVDHQRAQNAEERLAIAREELLTDLYLCSSNAITLDGALVNIDAMGNRTNAMTFGPKKVIIVASADKICSDVTAAFERIKTYPSPMTNRLVELGAGIANPCTKTGICVNCQVPTRWCRIYSVLRRKPMASDITVIILGTEGGF